MLQPFDPAESDRLILLARELPAREIARAP
jgi:hypothetical protein